MLALEAALRAEELTRPGKNKSTPENVSKENSNDMKKILLALTMLACVCMAASARDHYSHDINVLPAAARTVLKANFKPGVSVIKTDKDFGRVSEYEVILTDGSEVTFDRKGNWKDIESSINGSVPSKMIPKGISDFVKANQKNTRIVGIERTRGGYEVELSNGVEMKFDKNGRFLKYD